MACAEGTHDPAIYREQFQKEATALRKRYEHGELGRWAYFDELTEVKRRLVQEANASGFNGQKLFEELDHITTGVYKDLYGESFWKYARGDRPYNLRRARRIKHLGESPGFADITDRFKGEVEALRGCLDRLESDPETFYHEVEAAKQRYIKEGREKGFDGDIMFTATEHIDFEVNQDVYSHGKGSCLVRYPGEPPEPLPKRQKEPRGSKPENASG